MRYHFFHEVRSYHVEIFSRPEDCIIFNRRNYDAVSLSIDPPNQRLSTIRAALKLFSMNCKDSVEFNEPTYFTLWPRLILLASVARFARILGRGPGVVSYYCIENMDTRRSVYYYALGRLSTVDKVSEVVACTLAKLAPHFVSYLYSTADIVVFGSGGARENYSSLLGERRLAKVDSRVVLQLPARCGSCSLDSVRDGVVFIGSFEQRKGIVQLIDAWDSMKARRPKSSLLLIGKGPLWCEVERWASEEGISVSLLRDPPRSAIHRELSRAKVLVLLSQPEPFWREQLGLPIIEGLAHGCLIVTTEQTGLASWLDASGHFVADHRLDAEDFGEVLSRALDSARSPESVLRDLPNIHGRSAAADRQGV